MNPKPQWIDCTVLGIATASLALFLLGAGVAVGQDGGIVPIEAAEIATVMNDDDVSEDVGSVADEAMHIDLLSLINRGGRFMIPIGIMSLWVVALAAERMISLRSKKIIPADLVEELEMLAERPEGFSPSIAFQACADAPSPAATVVRGMLLRTGQPVGEIENAANETIQREADQHAAPIRWLHLAAAATPLMGLLGTVWGMIVAFHESTTLTPDRSRSEQLSEGIYTALVTTLAGLIVAIPAAILAQYLENRLAKLFHRVEELAFDVAPHMAAFVGRRRLDPDGNLRPFDRDRREGSGEKKSPTPPPVGSKARAGKRS
ncbi:MotA/TolQ/ExbB proton channel family protein [Novipirellula artificiosorum]|uniref:Colicin uptake protein TolQ n=1 Tax=Novipirellula artificiosorum TaxID=2528016 RepID=A0A5C6DZW2_9BACT|nr:MotA/TolQ/ExbB proton channel family protein [Novipirellula artificiosorum]TWU42150.1 colicin uptake protein TolQ [Novipirellula artificiosorum]